MLFIFPKLIESWQLEPLCFCRHLRSVPHISEPFAISFTFGESLVKSQLFSEAFEYFVIRPCIVLGWNRSFHNVHVGIMRACANIFSFQLRGGGKHNVGPLRDRCPPGFIDDHRFRLSPRLAESVEILVMMKWVATRPVDKAGVRILDFMTVVSHGFARLK